MTAVTRVAPRVVLSWDAPREAWLAERRRGITATDICKLIGVHKYGTALDVYWDKTEDRADEPAAGEAAEIGLLLEEPVTRMWCARTGLHAVRSAFYANGDRDWMRATPDREVYDHDYDHDYVGDGPADGLLEIKTALGWASREWGDDTVPDMPWFQVQWQLAVCGLDRAWIAVLAGAALKSYAVVRDQSLIDDLTAIGERFWADNVAKRVPPAPDGSERLARLLTKRWEPDPEKVVVLDPAVFHPACDEVKRAAADLKDAKARKTEAENRIRLLMGDAEAAVIDGQTVATWKTSERAGYTVSPSTTRTLRIKAGI